MKADWVDDEWMNKLRDGPPREVSEGISYFLWESSTMIMTTLGMPTDEDVAKWIEVLENRPDRSDVFIRFAIKDCKEYIDPNIGLE